MNERTPEQQARIQRILSALPALGRMGRSPQWRAATPEHRQTIIPALPGDTVAYVLGHHDEPADPDSADTDRVDAATFLAVIADDGRLRVFRLTEITPPDLPAIGGSSPSPEIAPPGRA